MTTLAIIILALAVIALGVWVNSLANTLKRLAVYTTTNTEHRLQRLENDYLQRQAERASWKGVK